MMELHVGLIKKGQRMGILRNRPIEKIYEKTTGNGETWERREGGTNIEFFRTSPRKSVSSSFKRRATQSDLTKTNMRLCPQ